MKRQPNTIYTLSLSYGKDSLACLGVIKELGLPLDRIIHAEIWATETIPADLPPMVEFKKKADKIIKERYGIEVEHVCATKKMGGGVLSYEQQFSTRTITEEYGEHIYGFPKRSGAWCVSKLKQDVLAEANLRRYFLSRNETSWEGGVQDYTVSLSRKDNGATTFSKSIPSITGFATKWSQYCTGELKRAILHKDMRIPDINQKRELVYPTQNKSFLQAQARWAV